MVKEAGLAAGAVKLEIRSRMALTRDSLHHGIPPRVGADDPSSSGTGSVGRRARVVTQDGNNEFMSLKTNTKQAICCTGVDGGGDFPVHLLSTKCLEASQLWPQTSDLWAYRRFYCSATELPRNPPASLVVLSNFDIELSKRFEKKTAN